MTKEPPRKEEKPYEPARINYFPGNWRLSIDIGGMRGPKSEDEKVWSFVWSAGAAVHLSPSLLFGIQNITYQSVDVPGGSRHSFTWAPVIEKQFLYNSKSLSHMYVYGGLAVQHRWGAELSGRMGSSAVGGVGLRGSLRCKYSSRSCGSIYFEARGYATTADFLLKPVILPQGAYAGTFAVGADFYFL